MIHDPAALDQVDRAILSLLQEDDRATNAAVGQKVGLSPAAVFERVKKLERLGVITGHHARVSPRAVGLGVTAFVAVGLESTEHCRSVAPALGRFPEVEECHSVAGEWDIMLKVRAASTKDLEDLLFGIKRLSGVARTMTTVVLSTPFEARPLPLDGPDLDPGA
ncbi:MAG TPA: Lrp/AsnC family transcriptional regulator [Deinococcales bacterium]|nr:Lrp/AsnC family transcriptional regulator [Deinococcales bacterium]